MKKLLVVVAGLSLPLTMGIAEAADLPQRRPVPREVWNWTGLYLGAHIGAGWGQSDFDEGRPAIYGNDVRTHVALGGMQAGYNWQASGSAWVIGAEAELSALGADGTNTCFATSGYVSSTNCRVRQSAMGSITGRIGYATGLGGRTLLYAKGGGAWLDQKVDMTSFFGATSQRSDRFGWVVGAGIEHAIAPAWSVKLEYDYADFGSRQAATPAEAVLLPTLPFAALLPVPGSTASVSQTMQTIKLGVNLKLGADSGARWGDVHASPLGLPVKAMPAAMPLGYEFEAGGRVWYSFGRFQKDLSADRDTAQQDKIVSRLTYDSESASGEVYARVDTPSNIVVKGFIGGGDLSRGKMIDEDWLLLDGGVPYSNTLSDPVKGSVAYVTADIGYDIIRDRGGKLAAFIGYNYLRDDKVAMGCVQLANPAGPCGAFPSANTVPGISEKNQWHSLRIGVNGVIALTEQLQLTADAAYLPYANFRGVDNHMQRVGELTTLSSEAGIGQGVQLEAILAYKFTPSFSVGAGGRYWAMWATGTDAYADAFGGGQPYNALPVRSERFGGFLQASYTFDSFR